MLNNKIHFNWNAYPLPMDNLEKVAYSTEMPAESSVFFRGSFEIEIPCDTFVKLESFKKGFVTVNGFNLGRYWEIGPQQTLYLPASILKKGKNEIVVFESDGLKGEPFIELVSEHNIG